MTLEQAQLQWQDDAPQSSVFDDIYFSPDNGLAETEYVFLQQGELSQRIAEQDLCVIGETGFGTGLNFFATWNMWREQARAGQQLHYISVEKYPLSVGDIRRSMSHWPQFNDMIEELCVAYPIRRRGHYVVQLESGRVQLHLLFDDIVPALRDLETHCDIWYLDGFAPSKNPSMWSAEVCAEIARHSKYGTRLTTFTTAGFVRRQLQACGFLMEKVPGFAGKRTMLRGVYTQDTETSIDQPWFHLSLCSQARSQLLIVGAGLAGTALAHRCAQAGISVSLYDAQGIASAASGNHAGMYQPSLAADESSYAQYYFSAWQLFIQQLDKISAQGFTAWDACGVVHILMNEREVRRAQKIYENTAQYDEWARAMKAQALGVHVDHGDHDILHIPQAGIVSPSALCQWYTQQSLIDYQQEQVSRIEYAQGKWHIFDADDRCLNSAAICVIASAYASMQFTQCESLRMQAVRGQLSIIDADAQSEKLPSALSADAYMTPALDGKHVLGATFQRDDFDLELRAGDQQDIMHKVRTFYPQLSVPSDVRGRCSLRASGPDRMPIVGQVIDETIYRQQYAELRHGDKHKHFPSAVYHPGLFVSTAHGSRGIVGTSLAAELLYAMICNTALPVSTSVYKAVHPGRFVVKELSRAVS